ncbi:hypothetical protein NA57DRAFT_55300 [Rhizodiscina lignyota]|uniref:uS12 prolyl 3,4-dihydroxylase n=1 Tax=Rhizodiscina lignyota TaxID=1504668 RepID=A0A9P4IEB9_9PEZI|nr:hypothetical protein NA57DRAFT_55300 [Rhizodiscina lignyota]
MKRQLDDATANGPNKKQNTTDAESIENRFSQGLFEDSKLDAYTKEYVNSQPYKHGVIQDIMDTTLLRRVRDEIQKHLSFTPKETDIYKIHQSGDLANLDGLDDSSLARLPSLLKLRDALYSPEFRKYISHIADAGPLSGQKTDMAINVYTPSCHLLCHDDVIGTRRVSYILYLTDPDKPWKAEWGGALRLYPTKEYKAKNGTMVKVPDPEFSFSIPPAFNQLSFFAVQPGESFHDVEEVYKQPIGGTDDDGSRVRMAISGWYHIPQEGEEGYEEGLEERLAEKSSLSQLQGRSDEFDLPQPHWMAYAEESEEEDEGLTEKDLSFLLKYMSPSWLTPDTVEEAAERFTEESTLMINDFLSKSFVRKVRKDVDLHEMQRLVGEPEWQTARPPHKHRFLFRQSQGPTSQPSSTVFLAEHELINEFLPSPQFKKWLSLVTGGLTITRSNVLARRFRKGSDYTLATGYDEQQPRLELSLGITPSKGWDGDDNGADETNATPGAEANGSSATLNGSEGDNVGGHEVYMAGDDDEDEVELKASNTGAGQRRKADPAVYRTAADDEDDSVLFTTPASWNTLSIVLRDKGVLRFVKYISKSAPGDRWDVLGEYDVTGLDEEEDDDEDQEET